MNVYQQYTIGTIFNIICFLGILAGIYPAKCSKKNLMQNPNVEADFISKDLITVFENRLKEVVEEILDPNIPFIQSEKSGAYKYSPYKELVNYAD